MRKNFVQHFDLRAHSWQTVGSRVPLSMEPFWQRYATVALSSPVVASVVLTFTHERSCESRNHALGLRGKPLAVARVARAACQPARDHHRLGRVAPPRRDTRGHFLRQPLDIAIWWLR